jgi:hypothetical protein
LVREPESEGRNNGSGDAPWHHQLYVGTVHVLEALGGTVGHFVVVVATGGCFEESNDFALVVDSPRFRGDRPGNVYGRVRELCVADWGAEQKEQNA